MVAVELSSILGVEGTVIVAVRVELAASTTLTVTVPAAAHAGTVTAKEEPVVVSFPGDPIYASPLFSRFVLYGPVPPVIVKVIVCCVDGSIVRAVGVMVSCSGSAVMLSVAETIWPIASRAVMVIPDVVGMVDEVST